MKRIFFTAILLLFVALALGMTPNQVYAQGTDTSAAATGECDAWFVGSPSCLMPSLKKAMSGGLNKQAGDIGTATFSMGQFVISGIGLCDSEANPDCPKGLSYQNSAMAGLSNATIAIYQHPPAQTSTYIADIGKTLGFMPKVQAQGIGFSGLSALLELWKAFRNIAYALLAAILIIVGFMVMFRKKIDPKTVVTVQNAIPRIVVALLLVTFSYAIVGFMIDLMYLSIVLAVSVVSGAEGASLGHAVSIATTGGTQPTIQEVTSVLFNGGVWGIFRFLFGSGFQAYDDIGAMITQNNPYKIAGWTVVPGLIGYLFGLRGAWLGLTSGPILLAVVLLIVLLFGFIRLIFMLLDAYINIIISLLTAPFQLMMEAVPGTNAFSNWFKNLLSKILVFPITAILLLVSAILTSQDVSTKIWAPPFLSTGEGAYGMAGLIGLGMLLVIPTVVSGIQKSLKAEPMVPGGIGTIMGPIGSGVGQLTQLWYQGTFIASGRRHKPDARTAMQVAREGADKGLGSITGGGGH